MARCPFPPEKASSSTLPPFERILGGDTSPATLDELRYAVTAWMMDDTGPDLSRVLGLGTRRSARLARRDALLRDAAALLDGSTWDKARALAAAVSRFESACWPRWRYTGVPDTACRLNVLLYTARRLGVLPTTARQYFNVLAGAA